MEIVNFAFVFSGTVLETMWKDKRFRFRNDGFLVHDKRIRVSLVETGTFLVNAKGIYYGNRKEPLTIFIFVFLIVFCCFFY